jgi:hypothetical protein
MEAKIQGSVWVECVVLRDGTVGEVKVIRSLDQTFGLGFGSDQGGQAVALPPGRAQRLTGANYRNNRVDILSSLISPLSFQSVSVPVLWGR